jgi:hypothetical protein
MIGSEIVANPKLYELQKIFFENFKGKHEKIRE